MYLGSPLLDVVLAAMGITQVINITFTSLIFHSSQHTFFALPYLDNFNFTALLSNIPASLHVFYPFLKLLVPLFLLNNSFLSLKTPHVPPSLSFFLMLLCELEASLQPWLYNPWFLLPNWDRLLCLGLVFTPGTPKIKQKTNKFINKQRPGPQRTLNKHLWKEGLNIIKEFII